MTIKEVFYTHYVVMTKNGIIKWKGNKAYLCAEHWDIDCFWAGAFDFPTAIAKAMEYISRLKQSEEKAERYRRNGRTYKAT